MDGVLFVLLQLLDLLLLLLLRSRGIVGVLSPRRKRAGRRARSLGTASVRVDRGAFIAPRSLDADPYLTI